MCTQVPFPARSIESLQTNISLTVLANTGPGRAGVDEEAGPSSRGSGGSNWQPLVSDIKLETGSQQSEQTRHNVRCALALGFRALLWFVHRHADRLSL